MSAFDSMTLYGVAVNELQYGRARIFSQKRVNVSQRHESNKYEFDVGQRKSKWSGHMALV
jgi:hypothetical protein